MAVEGQAVEEDPDHRHLGRSALDVQGVREPHPGLEPLEAGLAALVEGHDLAVEKETLHGQPAKRRDQLGIASRDRLAAPAVELDGIARSGGQHPDAVVLDLEEPRLARERALGQRGQHERLIPRGEIAPGRFEGVESAPERRELGGNVTDLFHGEAREDRLGIAIRQLLRSGGGIGLLEEEPLLLLLRHPGERPPPPHLVAEELDLQLPLRELIEGISLLRRPVPPAVPDDDGAGPVVVGWDHSLEVGVLERVIFHVHGEALLLGADRRALRDGPALQHPVHLEAQIVVEAPGRVLLDDEQPPPHGAPPAEGLRRPLRVALLPVRVELRRAFVDHKPWTFPRPPAPSR